MFWVNVQNKTLKRICFNKTTSVCIHRIFIVGHQKERGEGENWPIKRFEKKLKKTNKNKQTNRLVYLSGIQFFPFFVMKS